MLLLLKCGIYYINSETTYGVCVTWGYAKQRFTFKPTLETHAIHYQFTNTPKKTAQFRLQPQKKNLPESAKYQWANLSCDKAQAVHQHSSAPTPG